MSQVDNSGPLIVFHSPGNGAFEREPDTAEPHHGEAREFLESRERAERAAANSASSISAKRIHEELAERYLALIRRGGGSF